MGNSNTRPKICQVAPSHDQAMEDEPSALPASQWMITAYPGTEMQEQGILGQRKFNHLPPLTGRQDVPHNVHLEPVTSLTGCQSVCDKTGHSIIKSHPPQPVKGWQPMASPTEFAVHPAKHACMPECQDTKWRDGPFQHYSTPSQGGSCGTSNTIQGHMKGLLLAQTMLSRQATKKRQAQQRCFREKRGRKKRVYTSDVEGNFMEGKQRVRLVSRPTQRNIFWDESEGQILDARELLQPSPEFIDSNLEDMVKDKPQPDHELVSEDWRFEDPVIQSCEDASCLPHLDRGLTETVQRSCDLPWLQNWSRFEEKHSFKNIQSNRQECTYGHYSGLSMKVYPVEREEWETNNRSLFQANPEKHS